MGNLFMARQKEKKNKEKDIKWLLAKVVVTLSIVYVEKKH